MTTTPLGRRRLAMQALLLPAAALALPRPGRAAEPPIVVHHIGPLSGVLAASNKESIDGARLFLDALNARGGVHGRAVTIQTLDDAQDARRAKALLGELIAADSILALVMPRTTPSLEAMLPDAVKNGIPIVAPQTGASFVNEPPQRTVFTLRASYRKEAERAIQLQHSIGVRRFGLVLANDAFGTDTLVGIERAMKALQLEPVASAKVDNRNPDVTEAVKTLLGKQPEVVLMLVSSKAASEFVKAYRKASGISTFISLSNTSNNDYVKALGDQARGAIVMQVMPSPFSATTAIAREYGAASANKAPLSYAGLQGYTSAKLLAAGLQKAGPRPTRATLLQGMEALGEHDLGDFRVRFGPNERVGSSYVDSTIITHNGRFMR